MRRRVLLTSTLINTTLPYGVHQLTPAYSEMGHQSIAIKRYRIVRVLSEKVRVIIAQSSRFSKLHGCSPFSNGVEVWPSVPRTVSNVAAFTGLTADVNNQSPRQHVLLCKQHIKSKDGASQKELVAKCVR